MINLRHVLAINGLLFSLAGAAQEAVIYEVGVGNAVVSTSAIFSPAKGVAADSKTPAVVLIHSAGGWSDGTTAPLAKELNANGFATLELKLFETSRSATPTERLVPRVYGALGYLAARTDIDRGKVGIAGFSMGAHLSIWTASKWMTETYSTAGLKFAAHAPIYPMCWPHTLLARNVQPQGGVNLSFQKDFLTQWTGAPVKVFAAGQDDYDDRDPKACQEFIDAISPQYRGAFDIITYADATHGWNQASESFYARTACKGRGCKNNNVNNPAVTALSTADIVKFFVSKLK